MIELDQVILADSRDLSAFIDDETVSLCVTSPPYDVGKPYERKASVDDDHEARVKEYLDYLDPVWRECWRISKIGGRLVINIADTWRNPYIPLHSYLAIRLIENKWRMLGTFYWDKGSSAKLDTCFGSWKSPKKPCLEDIGEFIIAFQKTDNGLEGKTQPDITTDEFLEFRKSIWRINTVSGTRIGHPAPFPIELPRRAIKFYTYPGDIIVDPFCGSGQSLIAAKKTNRHYLGFDIKQEYIDLAKDRLAKYNRKKLF